MTEAVIHDEGFEVKQTTVIFVVLSIVTLGFYYYYWLLSTTRRINANISPIKISEVPVIIFCAILMASSEIMDTYMFEFCVSMRTSYTTYYSMVSIFAFALLVFGIVISIKLAASLRVIFSQNNENIPINTFLVVIFQGYYLYYLIHNRKELSIKANTAATIAAPVSQNSQPNQLSSSTVNNLAASAAGAKFCSNCGNEIMNGAKFCIGCGQPIAGAQQSNAQLKNLAITGLGKLASNAIFSEEEEEKRRTQTPKAEQPEEELNGGHEVEDDDDF